MYPTHIIHNEIQVRVLESNGQGFCVEIILALPSARSLTVMNHFCLLSSGSCLNNGGGRWPLLALTFRAL